MIKNAENSFLRMPEGLCPKGIQAYKAILAALPEGTQTGGCKAFYSPTEWKERGEKYGTDSVLIVVYDGSDLAHYFSMDHSYPTYEGTESMLAALTTVDLYSEECTGWFSAVYPG